MSSKNRKPRSPLRSPRPRRTKKRSSVSLLPFDPARHLPLLTEWLRLPHVRQWWGDPQQVLAQSSRLEPESQAIIAHNGRPVGYIRWRHLSTDDLHQMGIFGIPDSAADIQLFIGNAEQVGQGLGPAALERLLDRLRKAGETPLASICTSIDNTRSIRAGEKAGFTCVQQYDDAQWGRSWLMLAPLRDAPPTRVRRAR